MLETLCEQFAALNWVQWLGFITGVTGVYLSIKERLLAWPLFILCYSCYVYLSYQYGLKSFMLMNTIFIGISIYGWQKWARGKSDQQSDSTPVSRARPTHLLVALALVLIGTLGLGALFQRTGEASMPYLDSFATCCGFIAQWLLSRKHVETWGTWIITNSVYIYLLSKQGAFTDVLLFSIFILLAIKGWVEWKRLLRTENR